MLSNGHNKQHSPSIRQLNQHNQIDKKLFKIKEMQMRRSESLSKPRSDTKLRKQLTENPWQDLIPFNNTYISQIKHIKQHIKIESLS